MARTVLASTGPLQDELAAGAQERAVKTMTSVSGDVATSLGANRKVLASTGSGPSTRGYSFPQTGSDFERYVGAPFGRGIDQAQANFFMMFGDTEGAAEQYRQMGQSLQLTKEDLQAMEDANNAESLYEGFKTWLSNPGALTAMISQSFGTMAPGFVAAAGAGLAGGPAGAATAMGAYSGAFVEMVGQIEQQARERGVDPTNAKAMDELLAEPGFLKGALTKGAKRGLPIGVMDALSMGLAGKTYGLVRGAKKSATFGKRMAAALAELNTQGTLGALGEAGAGVATGEYRPGEIAAEYLGELVTGPSEIATAALSRQADAAPTKVDTPPDEDASEPPPTLGPIIEGKPETVLATTAKPPVPVPSAEQIILASTKVTPEAEPATDPIAELEKVSGVDGLEPTVPEGYETEIPAEETAPAEDLSGTGETMRPALTQWKERQKRIGNRERPSARNEKGSKKSPQVRVKNAMADLLTAMQKQKIGKDITLPNKNKPIDSKDWAAAVEKITMALPDRGQKVNLLRAFQYESAQETTDRINALTSIVSNKVEADILGTPFEPTAKQWNRWRDEMDTAFATKETNKDMRTKRISAIQNAYRLVTALFEKQSGVAMLSAEDKLDAKAVAKALETQPEDVGNTGSTLVEFYPRLFADNPTDKNIRDAYGELKTIGNALVKSQPKSVKTTEKKVAATGRKVQQKRKAKEILAEKPSSEVPAVQALKTSEDTSKPMAQVVEERKREALVKGMAPKGNEPEPSAADKAADVKRDVRTGEVVLAEVSDQPAPSSREKVSAPMQQRAMRTSQKLRVLRLGNRNKMARHGAQGLISGLPFFDGVLEGGKSQAATAASAIEALPKEARAEFFELVEGFLLADVQPYTERGQESAPAQALEREIGLWIDSNFTNANVVKPALIEYARSVRTMQNRGFEQGTVVLENRTADSYTNRAFLESLAPYEEAANAAIDNGGTMQQVLQQLRGVLPEGHFYNQLIEGLIRTGVDIPVAKDAGEGTTSLGRYFQDSRSISIYPQRGVGSTLHTLLHEMVHAVTHDKVHTDAVIRKAVADIFRAAVYAGRDNDFRGLANIDEFLAEAHSNEAFRSWLDTIGIETAGTGKVLGSAKLGSLWDALKRVIARIFKTRNPAFVTLLDSFLRIDTFATEQDILASLGKPEAMAPLDNIQDQLKVADKHGKNMLEKFHRAARGGNLGFMDLTVMRRNFKGLFDRAMRDGVMAGENLIVRLVRAVNRTAKHAQQLQNEFLAVTELVKDLTAAQTEKLGRAMEVVTRAQIDPTKPLDVANQPWLFSKAGKIKNRALVQEARDAYNSLKPDEAKALLAIRQITNNARDLRRGALLTHTLRSRLADQMSEEALEYITTSGTAEDAKAYVADNPPTAPDGTLLDVDVIESSIDDVFALGEIQGTYFPLKRNGNFAVRIDSDVKEDQYFAFFDTRLEAEEHAASLAAAGIEDAEVRPVGKNEGVAIDQRSLDAIKKMIPKQLTAAQIPGENAAQFEDAWAKAASALMADRILYSSQLKRKGVPGAQPKDMIKNVEDYVRSTLSVISTMESAYDYGEALSGMRALSEDTHRNVAPADQDKISAIRNELLLRAKEMAGARDVVAIDRILGGLGFFHYLGAPSYWILNATQTSVVGIPVLAALSNTSFVQATKSMGRAYKTLRAATQGLGWKALDDLEAVKERLTPEQAEVIGKLERDGAIQSTLAHEFNLLQRGTPVYNAVTSILTTMPDMIERWNRTSMALAALDSGLTLENDYAQIQEIVETSQFNYDPANRARLLRTAPEFMGGGARRFIAPIMMFKVFGVNMARNVYGMLWDGLTNNQDSSVDRKQALKIFGGLVGSHTLAGGMFGGLGLGMAQMVGAAVNAVLDDEDEIDWATATDSFIADHTNEYVARIATRGLPAAIGVDMSASVNLGNLLFMSSDIDMASYGGAERYAYSLLGPVAQYIAGGVREGAQLMDGQASVADFAEKAIPLKLYRSLSQSFRQNFNGLETGQGYQFLSPDDLDLGDAVIGALGLRPAVKSQRQQQFYAQRTSDRTLSNKKARLMSDYIDAANATERKRVRNDIREWNASMRRRRNYSLIIRQSRIEQSRKQRRERQRLYDRGEFSQFQ